jgi:hypothetical protein
MNKDKLVRNFVISTFVALYLLVSVISTIHVIDFFQLSNPYWLAVTLAIGFELGAAASLASLVILKKMNKALVWSLFIVITLMQMQGNMYYAFINLDDFQSWSELFNLIEEEPIYQKRILALVSGAILPLVALGFIKSLVDYIKPEEKEEDLETPSESVFDGMGLKENVDAMRNVVDAYDDLDAEIEKYGPVEKPVKSKEDDFDEDHGLDMVLNTIAADLEPQDLAEEEVWKDSLAETLIESTYTDEELEEFEEWDVTLSDGLEDEEEAVEEVADNVDEQEDLFTQALQNKAKENMNEFIKQNQNDQENTN